MASDNRIVDLYSELEVISTDVIATIKKSYRRLVLKYHPDKNPEDKAKAEEKIRKINHAYETLSVPAKRQHYDAQVNAMNSFEKGLRVDTALIQPRFGIPKAFMMCPMGHPDKFVRAAGTKLVVESRADRQELNFDMFFQSAKFTLWWLNTEDANNLCRLRTQASNVPVVHDTSFGPPPGWVLSFGLAQSTTCSDVTLCAHEQPTTTNVIAQASPEYPGAFRFEAAYFSGCHVAFDPPDRIQMKMSAQPVTKAIEDATLTKRRHQSSTIDFMLLDYACAEEHRTLDEVMIPVVMELGGDKKPVQLMHVCRHTWIQKFFQIIMGGNFWDFTDFAMHFQAHDDTWEYDEKNRLLRLRSLGEQAMCALKKARNLAEVVHVVLVKANSELTQIPLDAIERGLTMCSKAKVASSEPVPGSPMALKRLLLWLRQICRSIDQTSSDALASLIRMWRPLADVGLTDSDPGLPALASEVQGAIVAHATNLLELKEAALDYSLLELLLEMPLDWEKCGEPLSQKGQPLIVKEGVQKLMPLLRLAASAKATKFGESLANSMMMKLLGVVPEVAMDALDAMVSGGFGLEGVPMMLQMLLPKVSLEAGARVVVGLAEHNATGASFDACWETVVLKEGSLNGLPKDLQDRLNACRKTRKRSRSRQRRSKGSD